MSVTERGILSGDNLFEFLSPIKEKEIKTIKDYEEDFICLIKNKSSQINFLKKELQYKKTENDIRSNQNKLKQIEEEFKQEVCAEIPTAFWDRKSYEISLPYKDGFNETNIPTKAKPVQMNQETLRLCKEEIKRFLNKKLIRPSKSPWSCAAFYVNNANEKERGEPRMVINYKPLNNILKWIRYPLPNKQELIKSLYKAVIFSKFDMKSRYYQIKVKEEDKYKTASVVPFGHYEWNVMPMGLKNAPSEFQNIMNNILIPYLKFAIVYLDDVLIYSDSFEQHLKHLRIFKNLIKRNGLVVSSKKMTIGVTKIRFLCHEIWQGKITPIARSIEFAKRFPNEITNKTQLQRFLGCLNYVSEFIPEIRIVAKPLFKRLRKNPKPWDNSHTQAVKKIKSLVNNLPCLGIQHPEADLIVETDASELGFGGILKQKLNNNPEQIIKYHSGA